MSNPYLTKAEDKIRAALLDLLMDREPDDIVFRFRQDPEPHIAAALDGSECRVEIVVLAT